MTLEFFKEMPPNLAAIWKTTAVPSKNTAVHSKITVVRLKIASVPSKIMAVPSRITPPKKKSPPPSLLTDMLRVVWSRLSIRSVKICRQNRKNHCLPGDSFSGLFLGVLVSW